MCSGSARGLRWCLIKSEHMHTKDFHYHLPPNLIAQRPPRDRDGGRLMVLDRGSASGLTHKTITDLPDLLPEGCLLVVNDSRVIPARLAARRSTGGKVEVFLLERLKNLPGGQQTWRCMLRASKRLRRGEALELLAPDGEPAPLPPMVLQDQPRSGRASILLPLASEILAMGSIPLPPYITREADDQDTERYQTVYAEHEGSVAAPTAGLHFTPAILEALESRGVQVARVTLHVGPGTFSPVRTARLEDHKMESEAYEVPQETAAAVARAKAQGRPVVAVGTTVVRTLETSKAQAGPGRSELFIYPGHAFQVVDGLLTNFHLPGSTLIMLVAALTSRDRVLAAYREAVQCHYRFYSYGDAMLIV